MLRYAITDEHYVVRDAERWATQGVDLVQLRAKTLQTGALAGLGHSILSDIAKTGTGVRLLINGRADVAIAIGAAGVHLTAREDELTPTQVRVLYRHAGLTSPIVSVSCHTLEEVTRARDNDADLILFGPVFEKRIGQVVTDGVGLSLLAKACEQAKPVRVLALGGVTPDNAPSCIAAGAAGFAAIRAFVE